jgi:hypothetical protein
VLTASEFYSILLVYLLPCFYSRMDIAMLIMNLDIDVIVVIRSCLCNHCIKSKGILHGIVDTIWHTIRFRWV